MEWSGVHMDCKGDRKVLDGSEKLPPFVIGKAAWPWAFNKKSGQQLGFHYQNNVKAWMTAHLYQDWIQEWD